MNYWLIKIDPVAASIVHKVQRGLGRSNLLERQTGTAPYYGALKRVNRCRENQPVAAGRTVRQVLLTEAHQSNGMTRTKAAQADVPADRFAQIDSRKHASVEAPTAHYRSSHEMIGITIPAAAGIFVIQI